MDSNSASTSKLRTVFQPLNELYEAALLQSQSQSQSQVTAGAEVRLRLVPYTHAYSIYCPKEDQSCDGTDRLQLMP